MKPKVNIQSRKQAGGSMWQPFAILMALLLIPWALYINFHPRLSFPIMMGGAADSNITTNLPPAATLPTIQSDNRLFTLEKEIQELKLMLRNQKNETESLAHKREEKTSVTVKQPSSSSSTAADLYAVTNPDKVMQIVVTETTKTKSDSKETKKGRKHRTSHQNTELATVNPDNLLVLKQNLSVDTIFTINRTPVLGPIPTNGIKPLFGGKHKGEDAIFALACKYPKEYYQRFVGSVRKFGFNGDVVLAVSPPSQMHAGVEKYLKETNVVAYGFEVDCLGKDNCKLRDEFLGLVVVLVVAIVNEINGFLLNSIS